MYCMDSWTSIAQGLQHARLRTLKRCVLIAAAAAGVLTSAFQVASLVESEITYIEHITTPMQENRTTALHPSRHRLVRPESVKGIRPGAARWQCFCRLQR